MVNNPPYQNPVYSNPEDIQVKSPTNINPTIPSVIELVEKPFKYHKFIKAPDPLSSIPHTYSLEHPADFLIVQGTYDYQFEIDRNVQPDTPVVPALIYGEMPVKVNEYIQYQLSPEVVANLGEVTGDFYIYLFWNSD